MNKRSLSSVVVLLLFAVFMISVLMILLKGADVVGSVTDRDKQSYQRRTAVQYITTRVHQADAADSISVQKINDTDALVLSQEIDGIMYDTMVYCYEGYLMELFCERGLDLELEFGEQILPLDGLRADTEGDGLQITLTFPEGDSRKLYFCPMSEGGAGYEE